MDTVIEQGSLHGYGFGGDEEEKTEKAIKLISEAIGYLVEASKAIHAKRYDTALELIGDAEGLVRTSFKYVDELR